MKKLIALLALVPFLAFASPPVTIQYAADKTFYVTSDGFDGVVTDRRALANVAASQTDAVLVTAVTGRKIRLLASATLAGTVATNLTFNTKGAGAGVAISPLFANASNSGAVLPFNPLGWVETNTGEALTVTTGAGSTTGILITYVVY